MGSKPFSSRRDVCEAPFDDFSDFHAHFNSKVRPKVALEIWLIDKVKLRRACDSIVNVKHTKTFLRGRRKSNTWNCEIGTRAQTYQFSRSNRDWRENWLFYDLTFAVNFSLSFEDCWKECSEKLWQRIERWKNEHCSYIFLFFMRFTALSA